MRQPIRCVPFLWLLLPLLLGADAPPRMNPRVAITDAAFAEHTLAEAVDRALRLGFRSMATHHGGPRSFDYPHLELDTSDEPARLQTRRTMSALKHISIHQNKDTDWKPWIDGAAFIGARIVTIHQKPGVANDHQIAMLREAGDYAAARNVRIAVENIGGTFEEFVELIRGVDHPAVGVCIDTGHVPRLEHIRAITVEAARAAAINDAIDKLVRIAGDKLWHMHVHNVRPADKWRDHYADIRGPIDFPRLMSTLHEIGYDGMLVCELHRRDETLEQKAEFGWYISGLWDKGTDRKPHDEQ